VGRFFSDHLLEEVHMLKDTFRAQSEEIVVDMFAGAGGASCGLEMAGIHVHAAINHDPVAVSLHARNHPETEHHVQDVYTLSPQWVTRGRRVGLLWMSPDCTHHSKAKGGAPTRNVRRRELAMVLVDRWIPELGDRAPRVVLLENVEEFAEWGPLDNRGRIIESAKGERFRTFVRKLRSCGYRVDWRELRACDYGAPTIRKRLFMIARRDNRPIVWPEPTHGAPDSPEVLAGTRKPWKTAAECIDWSLPCPSIFASSEEIMERYDIRAVRPLAENTLKRIAKGVVRYVLSNSTPFIVSYYGPQSGEQGFRGCGIESPLPTQTCENRFALVRPFLAKHFGGVVGQPVDVPAGTVTTIDHHSLCAAHMVKMRGSNVGDAADSPLHTVSAEGTHHALCAAHLQRDFGNSIGAPCGEPVPTVMPGGGGKTALVSAFLAKYYGQGFGCSADEPLHTVTTKDRFGLVTASIAGTPYFIADIGMRMLTPRELARAQGFPAWYVLEQTADGTPITKTAQVRGIGNSVCPPIAATLASANYSPQEYPVPEFDMPLLALA
jgi:DNA (cytosine-5)-methyltransferase 1